MRKSTLFDTPFAKARTLQQMVPPALTFLIKNKEAFINEAGLQTLTNLKLYSSASICKIFQTLAENDKLKCFTLLDLTSFQNDVPELLTLDKVVVDGKHIQNIPVPTPLQKCWINLTPVLRKENAYNGALIITDVTQLSAMIVKAFLCSTYNDSDMWLNPKLATFVIESYSMTVAGVLSNAYNLDLFEKRYVQTLFAMYYAQLLGGVDSDLDQPPLLMRCSFLGSAADIARVLETIRDKHKPGTLLTPTNICQILAEVGPSRMKKFSEVQLYRYLSSSAMDSIEMMIAMDYPPYWVYQLLRVAAGYKNPVMSNIIKLSNTKAKVTQFCQELESSPLVTKFNR